MRETGTLMKGDMVRATLADRKTQTRRFIDRLKGFGKITEFGRSDTPGYDWCFRNKRMLWNDLTHTDLLAACPWGTVGDRLWGRETFRRLTDDFGFDSVQFRSDGAVHQVISEHGGDGDAIGISAKPTTVGQWNPSSLPKWTPSIHMPRWASRITLEITDVRVERLNEIRRDDAIAEGVDRVKYSTKAIEKTGGPEIVAVDCWKNYTDSSHPFLEPRESFESLWESIYGHASWAANPWLWVIRFKRVEAVK